MKALVVHHNGTATLHTDLPTDDANNLRWIQQQVGGYVEVIWSKTGLKWHAYVNEDGRMMGLPINVTATKLLRRLGHDLGGVMLVGDVVLVGINARAQRDADVPELVLALARSIGIEIGQP